MEIGTPSENLDAMICTVASEDGIELSERALQQTREQKEHPKEK